MPWNRPNPMEERIRFVMEATSDVFQMSELCQRYGVSRKTGYKWLRRYRQEGLAGLQDRSRASRHCPHRTPQAIADILIEARHQRPHWGAGMLMDRLTRRQPEVKWATSTAQEILKQAGLIQPKRRRKRRQGSPHSPLQLGEVAPHEVLTADFKGEFRTRDRRYCYPLTIADHTNRYLLPSLLRQEGQSSRSFGRSFESMDSPGRFLRITGPLLRPRGWRDFPGWPFGGFDWESSRCGSRPGIRSKIPAMSGCTEPSSKRPPGPLPATDSLNNRCLIGFGRSTTRNAPIRDSRPRRQQTCTAVPHELIRNAFYRWSIRGTGRFVASAPTDVSVLRERCCFSTTLWKGQKVGLEETKDGIWSFYFGPVLLGGYDERQQYLYRT